MEKHLNFFFLTDQLIKTILYWKNMKVYHREMYLQLVSITMLGPLNVFLILRVLPCQSEYTNYTDSCYIFLCIINCTVSFLSPYTIKDWYLLQTAYSVLTVFKSWRWTSSLLRGTSGLIYIFSSLSLMREKSQELQQPAARFPFPQCSQDFSLWTLGIITFSRSIEAFLWALVELDFYIR